MPLHINAASSSFQKYIKEFMSTLLNILLDSTIYAKKEILFFNYMISDA